MITSVRKVGNKVILKVHEDIIDMKSGEAFKAALMEIYSSGEKEVVLDLGSIHLINSHGIGKILMFYKRFQEIGGQMCIAPLGESIKEIFETMMLDKLIPEMKV
jgi:anti-anti-sigma factor